MKKLAFAIAVAGLSFAACKKEGCTDSTALNYDSKADEDDGSCEYADTTGNGTDTTGTGGNNGGGTDTSGTDTTGTDTTVAMKYKHISAASMDSASWKEIYLLPFSDVSMGFDFSKGDYADSTRDGWLEYATMSFENASIFGGNRVKKESGFDPNVDYKIPTTWDAQNDSLMVGSHYAVQCLDGYAIFKVKSYMSCCGEYEIKYVFVADADLVEK